MKESPVSFSFSKMDSVKYIVDVSYGAGKRPRIYSGLSDIWTYHKLEYIIRDKIEHFKRFPEICLQYKDDNEWIAMNKADEEVRHVLNMAEVKDDYRILKLLVQEGSSPQVSTGVAHLNP